MGAALPKEIAFLRSYISDERVLHGAARRARGCDVTATLLAEGGISDAVYLCSLADHLDLPVVRDWPELDAGQDVGCALRAGRVRLAQGGWLLAPTGRALRLLLATRRRGLPLPAGIALTTPAHLVALVGRRLPGQIARRIGSSLADAAPHLSARDALRGRSGAVCFLAGAVCLAGLACGARAVIDLLGLVFFAALAFRLLLSAAGWQQGETNEPALPDERLPLYSVLVPLRDEAAVVPSLVAALAALDYPRAKLDIVFLVEADDGPTRLALLAAGHATHGLAPHMRVFTVPAGAPRTKPRALNAGLLLARGDLLTVYDAEDRPDPRQLRRAASRFAVAPRRPRLPAGAAGRVQRRRRRPAAPPVRGGIRRGCSTISTSASRGSVCRWRWEAPRTISARPPCAAPAAGTPST